jgi:hypothetical protein
MTFRWFGYERIGGRYVIFFTSPRYTKRLSLKDLSRFVSQFLPRAGPTASNLAYAALP